MFRSRGRSTPPPLPYRQRDGEPPLEALESRQLLSAAGSIVVQPAIEAIPSASSAVSGFTPAQLKQAYGINAISLKNVTANGAGQTIAIVDAYRDPNLAPDMATFDAKFGLPAPSMTVVNSSGATYPLPVQNAGWDQEIDLDMEWAHAIAPSAKLLLVEANSADLTDLLTAVRYARSVAGVSVISMSWGATEFFGENNYDSTFTTPSGHANETFVAASGDDNSTEWPSSSPNVLSVGGTTLYTTNSSGTYWYEGGWASGGGGYSAFEPEPAYQEGAQQSGSRTTPDVSYDANPSTGVAVYDSTAYGGKSGWIEVGGTSVAAPQWAGLVAIADQGRAASGKATLSTGGLLTALYDQYDPYDLKSSTYLASFHDVNYNLDGGYVAGTVGFFQPRDAFNGYDLVTGLGSPRAPGLESALVAASGATASVVEAVVNGGPAIVAKAGIDAGMSLAVDRPMMESAVFAQDFGAVSIGSGTEEHSFFESAAVGSVAPMIVGAEHVITARAIGGMLQSAVWCGNEVSDHAATVSVAMTADARIASEAAAPIHLLVDASIESMCTKFSAAGLIGNERFGAEVSSAADHSWRLATAAALAAAGFLWWWSDAERREDGAARARVGALPV